MRKIPLVNGCYYHIVTRSIAKYEIFNNGDDYLRIMALLDLYRFLDFQYKYSKFIGHSLRHQKAIVNSMKNSAQLVEIVAYCIMPTHIHLILKQKTDNGISKYMARVLDAYTRYFNVKYHRTGPLWEGRFKSVLVDTDEQLLHLTRYLHLNPTSAGLVKKPQDWQFSSYREYVRSRKNKSFSHLCQFEEVIDVDPKEYRNFVHDRINYQKEISKIKKLLIENYTG